MANRAGVARFTTAEASRQTEHFFAKQGLKRIITLEQFRISVIDFKKEREKLHVGRTQIVIKKVLYKTKKKMLS